ncbi:MAG: hypothetical protein JXA82_13465 [Sedimentisphaerales bacterium]|nr:hypothetical protein [Sedimentisphaerales bacterium]
MKRILLMTVVTCLALVVGQAGAQVVGEAWAPHAGAQADPTAYYTGLRNPNDTRVTSPFVLADFGIPAALDGDTPEQFTLREVSLIQIATGGDYTFQTNSDDGSLLWIGDWWWPLGYGILTEGLPELPQLMPLTLVVNNDGDHGTQVITGAIHLEPGIYGIMVGMYENGGGEVLEMGYSGPDTSNTTTITADALIAPPALPTSGATNPSPVIDQTGVEPGTQPLSWEVMEGTSELQEWRIYVGESLADVNDLVTLGTPTATLAGDATELTIDTTVEDTSTYYWRVDAVGTGDANNIEGFVWRFHTVSYGPQIVQQPQDQKFGPACQVSLTVLAEPRVEGQGGEITYAWYREMTDGDDVLAGTGNTLVTDVPGRYYVIASNDVTSEKSETASVASAQIGSGGEGVLYDFEGGPGFTVNGSAVVANGYMQLTQNVGSLQGSVIFDPISTNPVTDFQVSFDFMTAQAGADGMSFALIDPSIYNLATTFGESGPGNGSLSVGIDLYDNGGEAQAGGNYLDIRLNGTIIASAIPSFTMEATGWHHVEIAFVDNKLTLEITPAGGSPEILFDEVAVSGYTPFVGQFGFGARTGGAWMEQGIDNVRFGGPTWATQNIEISPVDGNGWLDYDAESVTVTWDKADYGPCDAVYSLYMSQDSEAVSDPNSGLTPVYEGTDMSAVIPNVGTLDLVHDQMWYYRIDVSSEAGAGTQVGETFSFLTVKWVPEIATNPAVQNVMPAGSDLTLTYIVTTINDDVSDLQTVTWKRVVGEKDGAEAGDDDIISVQAPVFLGVNGKKEWDCSVTLTIENISHEGVYYCVAENSSGAAVSSDAVVLTERLMIWYEFEAINNGVVVDSSPTHADGTLTSPLTWADRQITGGVVEGVLGNAIDLIGASDPNAAYLDSGKKALDLGIMGAAPRSVSVWARTRDMARSGIYSIGEFDTGMAVFGVHNQNQPGEDYIYQFDHWGSNFNYADWDAFDTWVHIAHVYDGQNIRIYVNGVKIADYAASLNTSSSTASAPLAVGFWGSYDASYQHGVFDGMIDEFRLYNYALSIQEIGQLWIEGGGAGGCVDPLPQDVNDDCKVDLQDFAAFAASWMESSLVSP